MKSRKLTHFEKAAICVGKAPPIHTQKKECMICKKRYEMNELPAGF